MQNNQHHETIFFSLKAIVLTLLALLIFQVSFAGNAGDNEKEEAVEAFDQFQLAIIGNLVQLEWNATADADHFEIEVASGIDETGELIFSKLDELTAAEKINYTFIDSKTTKEGLLYYRVRQITATGEIQTSDIRTANFIFKDNFTLNVHTDEFLMDIKLHINSRSNGQAELSISGIGADFSLAKKISIVEGVNQVIIELEKDLPKGNYLLSFNYNGDTQHIMVEKKKDSNLIVVSE